MQNPFKKENLRSEIMTLHIHHKSDRPPLIIQKIHLYTTILLAVVIASGGMYSYSSYRITKEKLAASSKQLDDVTTTKTELEQKALKLETENKEYNDNLEKLEDKANEIESKINELEGVKDDLYNKLDSISINGESKGILSASSQVESDINSFSTVVYTPLTDFKTTKISAQLSDIDQIVEAEKLAFVDVSANVVETVSNATSMPSMWPVRGQVSSEFGYRSDPLNSSSAFHQGLDIRCPIGTPVIASASGRVKIAEYSSSYGYMVEISHGNGYTTLYAHNSELNVQVGDMVKQGDIISYSGATGRVTGPHVHFEIKLNGELQDPREYLK